MKKTTLALGLVAALGMGSCAMVPRPMAPTGTTAYGLTTTGQLATFGIGNAPQSVRTMNITGLTAGDTLVALDYRNTDNRLYAFASNGRVYTVNPQTGVATADGSNVGRGVVTADFNPVANRLRVIGTNNMNFRLTVNAAPVPSASPAGTVTEDGTFMYATDDANTGRTPNLVASAYTNSFNDMGTAPSGATTTLYSFDATTNSLVIHEGGPQFSTLRTVAPLGVTVMSGMVAFDISGANMGHAVVASGGNTALYSVRLSEGSAPALTLVATMPGVQLRALALTIPAR